MAHSHHGVVDACIAEIDRLFSYLKKGKTAQVRSADEKSVAKATALAWFNQHRPSLIASVGAIDSISISDSKLQELIEFTDRATTRAKYYVLLKEIRASLATLRNSLVSGKIVPRTISVDSPPDFSKIVGDAKMKQILIRRWEECCKCIAGDAALAATVMMGGLLEALFLARVNAVADKSSIFSNPKAPRDKQGKTLPLQEWTLKYYIDVAEELGWITVSAKDVSAVIRDYRNYVHPYKEYSHNVSVAKDDAVLFWEIAKQLARQILK